MNVKELIQILEGEVNEVDRESSQIEFWIGDKQYDIKSMGGFSLSPDITIELEEVESPIIKPATFKAEHKEMVENKIDEIINAISDEELNIYKEVEGSRYSKVLQEVLEELGSKKLLRKDYESNYQGFVDVDVLLNDGRVFSYKYYYGSCSGCDEWEAEGYTDKQIKNIMLGESTIFNSIEDYKKWRKSINK